MQKKLIEQGERKQIVKSVLNFHELGLSNDKIAKGVGISIAEVERIIKEHK